MEYADINSLLSGLELNTIKKEQPKIENIEDEEEILKIKRESNNRLCFRDMDHQKHNILIPNKFNKKDDVDENSFDNTKKINKELNNRMFDLNSNIKLKPIMDFYPKSSRMVNKKNKPSN